MPQYSYVALDSLGQRHRGMLTADSEVAAIGLLQLKQMQVVSVMSPTAVAPSGAHSTSKPARTDAQAMALLVDEMATLLESGVPLAEAIATLAQGSSGAHPLARVLASVRGGSSFSAALADSAFGLPEYALQLVRAGESTGNLAAALRSAAEHLEADRLFAQEARSALIYPAVLVGSGVVATLVMFVFVVPRFAAILDNPKAELPLVSRLVLGVGLWFTQHQMLALGSLAALAIGLALAFRQPGVRTAAWELAARMPVLGAWMQHAELARWAALFGVLLSSRVPLLAALKQANQTFRQRGLRSRADLVLSEVRGGKALSLALDEHALLDRTGINLVQVGERAGALAATVTSLARMHANQSKTRLKRFLVLLEPLTILLISVVLGGIMISVMLAITSLTNAL